jgi:hypothetical protein
LNTLCSLTTLQTLKALNTLDAVYTDNSSVTLDTLHALRALYALKLGIPISLNTLHTLSSYIAARAKLYPLLRGVVVYVGVLDSSIRINPHSADGRGAWRSRSPCDVDCARVSLAHVYNYGGLRGYCNLLRYVYHVRPQLPAEY